MKRTDWTVELLHTTGRAGKLEWRCKGKCMEKGMVLNGESRGLVEKRWGAGQGHLVARKGADVGGGYKTKHLWVVGGGAADVKVCRPIMPHVNWGCLVGSW